MTGTDFPAWAEIRDASRDFYAQLPDHLRDPYRDLWLLWVTRNKALEDGTVAGSKVHDRLLERAEVIAEAYDDLVSRVARAAENLKEGL